MIKLEKVIGTLKMTQSVLTKNDNGEAKRKRDAKKARSDFDTWHESNTKNVYAVWDMTKDIIKPTKFWKNMLKADQMVYQPFKPDELMGEGASVHNLCWMADKKKQLPTGEFHNVNLWISMLHGAFDRKAATYELTPPRLDGQSLMTANRYGIAER